MPTRSEGAGDSVPGVTGPTASGSLSLVLHRTKQNPLLCLKSNLVLQGRWRSKKTIQTRRLTTCF